MTEFKNVTVVKKANVYFDGKVTSRTVLFADGTKKTLGIMMPGDYELHRSRRNHGNARRPNGRSPARRNRMANIQSG